MKKWLKEHKRPVRLGLAALALALLCAGCLLAFAHWAGAMDSQRMAERFRGESGLRFAQVSAFFPEGKGQGRAEIHGFRQKLGPALADAAVEAPENGSLWQDAYSGTAGVRVSGTKGAANVTALGLGGDWFAFHPLRLRSGVYITEDDLMHDRVLLDETLAWQLFGGYDLAGLEVTIDGKPYLIAGVVAREEDAADRRAMDADAGMLYMHFDAMDALTPETDEPITCYELVCADPISGFALGLLASGFPDAVTVENTGRFSLGGAAAVVGQLGTRAMSQTAIALPYWENAARYTEDILAALLVAAVLLGLFPLGLALFLLLRLLVRAWRRLRDDLLPDAWEKLSDRTRARQRRALERRERRRDAQRKAAGPDA